MLTRAVAVATPAITLLLLTAVGLDVRVADFRALGERPRVVLAGVVLPLLLLPPIAWAITRLLEPAPIVAASLLLLSICPTSGLVTTYSLLARANAALAVTVVAGACAAALVTMPVASAALEWLTAAGGRVGAPVATLSRQILVGLAPPVLLGMALRARWPEAATRALPLVQRAGFALLAMLILLVFAEAWGRTGVPWGSAVGSLVPFLALSYAAGRASARLIAAPAGDRFVLGAAFAARNVVVGLAVAMTLGRQAEFVWFGAVYLVVQMPVLLLAAWTRARLTAS